MEKFLSHYGVLGMKWGVRRSEQPGYSKTPKYDSIRDSLKAGSIVYRVSSNKNEFDSGRTFVFSKKEDADKFARKLKELSPHSEVYNLTLKVKKDLIGPSEKERVDSFLENYKQKRVSELVNGVKEDATKQGIDVIDKDGDNTLTNYRAYTIAVSKNVRGLGNYANAKDAWKGFDMRRDDYQRGFTQLSKNDTNPIDSLDSAYLIFSRSSALQTISGTEVKGNDAHVASSDTPDDLYPGSFFNQKYKDIF